MRGKIVEQDGQTVIVHEESMGHLKAVADAVQRLSIEGHHGDREMRHLAEFPGALIQQYCDTNGIAWDDWFKNPEHARRMMKDPSLSHFLVWKGGRA